MIPQAPAPFSFDDPDLARKAEALEESLLDRLPFGAIRLDEQGVVRVYSGAERRLSGSGNRERLGHDFFTEIAPCMNTEEFRGRIDRARAAGRLDLEFGYVGGFADGERELAVRIQSASDGGVWIFMRREE